MAKSSNNEEPGTAPQPDIWYNVALGPSFKDHHHPSPKLCTLRYDFKPASIDKNQSGSLHKKMDNRVTVEFQNNQHGKPKVSFEGTCEEYKESDAVLFFDGQTCRLERLHWAVKRLRHVRLPGESAAVANFATTASVGATAESYSPPLGKRSKVRSLNNDLIHQIPTEVGRIDIGISESLDAGYSPSHPNPSTSSPDSKDCELKEDIDIVNDNEDDFGTAENENPTEMEFNEAFDINLPHPVDMDDEIAEVDVNDDVMDKGPNAAEALRAQVNGEVREVNGEVREVQTSSTSSSSGSGSKSGSGSGGGDSESSDGDSVIST